MSTNKHGLSRGSRVAVIQEDTSGSGNSSEDERKADRVDHSTQAGVPQNLFCKAAMPVLLLSSLGRARISAQVKQRSTQTTVINICARVAAYQTDAGWCARLSGGWWPSPKHVTPAGSLIRKARPSLTSRESRFGPKSTWAHPSKAVAHPLSRAERQSQTSKRQYRPTCSPLLISTLFLSLLGRLAIHHSSSSPSTLRS